MIPHATNAVSVESSLTGESGEFTVDTNSLAHIMSVLSNLYADPEMAVVREYLTNGFDAQIEAGMKPGTDSWKPIQVTTPSHFNKSYVIRDFGVGMSVDDLKNVYSKYGASTKRESNDVVGMLGLGSKSALTYTNSFTITGIKNGVKAKAIISVNEEGVPVFHIVDTRATTEPSGVEISIPVKDRNSFADKTRRFLLFWDKGLVEVDGKAPQRQEFAEVKPGTFLADTDRYGVSGSYIVMGNVAYRVDEEYVDQRLRDVGMNFISYVPIGAVSIVPSREKLFYNVATKAYVKSLSKGLYDYIIQTKAKEITDAPTHAEAFKIRAALPYSIQRTNEISGLKYKGDVIVTTFKHEHRVLSWDYNDNGKIAERSAIDLNWLYGMSYHRHPVELIVTGVEMDKRLSPVFKRKIRHYQNSNNISDNATILVKDDIDSVWADGIKRITADKIKEVVLPKTPRTSTAGQPKVEAPYDFYQMDNGVYKYEEAVTINTTGKTLCYISPADMRETRYKRGTDPAVLVKSLGDNVILAVLGTNRFEKFLRAYPNAVPARKVVQERINALVNSATDAEWMKDNLDYSTERFMRAVNPALILDPEVQALAKAVNTVGLTSNYEKAKNLMLLGRYSNMDGLTIPDPPKAAKFSVIIRYPLVRWTGSNDIDHTVFYMNHLYKERYAPKK